LCARESLTPPPLDPVGRVRAVVLPLRQLGWPNTIFAELSMNLKWILLALAVIAALGVLLHLLGWG
jgi:hypothetical protein